MAPVLIFTYKKLAPLKSTIEALKNNTLAPNVNLIIFSDGPKSDEDKIQVDEVRNFLNKVSGFATIKIHEAINNKGLADSIIYGVSKVLKSHKSVIVLEDDLVTSSNFLEYMNEALAFYEDNCNVHSISGYTVPIKTPKEFQYDNYFTKRATSWGWATWRDRWDNVDWNVSDYKDFRKDRNAQNSFNRMGSDMTGMLKKQMNGDISSWAIRWCYHQFKKDLFTVYPIRSKISNIGFGENATHTKGNDNRFATTLDNSNKINFNFNPTPELNKYILNQFTAKYSLRTRAFYKIKNLLGL